jgi:tRNA threonylcarbamoyladenosine biosynthesis protein TsaE
MHTCPPSSALNTPTEANQQSCHLVWHTLEDTAAFAKQLSQQNGIHHLFITLFGDLGSGKTTLVRHLLENFGLKGRVKSPTYTIIESYELPLPKQCKSSDTTFTVSHFDFYRFQDENEWEEAGFRDVFANPGLQIVEWPEKVQSLLPKADLEIHIQVQANESRTVVLKSLTQKGLDIIQAF